MANSEVKLYGMWASPFVRRVELTLRIRGIPFEYIEENLKRKSQQLLQYNPVHKLVPVLLHNGKPLCESLIIIEYIEETWHQSPRVLPEVPYERAKVRFWANFIDQKILEQMRTILKHRTQENITELTKSLDVLEEHIDSIFPSGINPTVIGESLGLLDILIATFSGLIGAYEEAIEVKFVDPEKHQSIVLWIKAVDAVQVVKETVPSHEKLVEFFRSLVEFFRSFGKK